MGHLCSRITYPSPELPGQSQSIHVSVVGLGRLLTVTKVIRGNFA